MYPPSFYAHIFNGMFLFFAILFMYWNMRNTSKLDPYKMGIFLLVASIAFGVHGISHLGLEYVYNYNPLYWNNY